MTNLQLLLTIGIPSFLVVLSWLSNNTRFALNEKRLDDLEKRLDKRFDEIDQRFAEVDRRFTEFHKRFVEIDRRFASIDRRLDEVIMAQHRDALEIMRNMTPCMNASRSSRPGKPASQGLQRGIPALHKKVLNNNL